MKRLHKILLTSLLTLGVFAFLGAKEQETVETSATNPTYELYVAVKDKTELFYGDTVIIASGSDAVGGLGGNPCFTYANNIAGGNNDGTRFYFTSTTAIKFTVGAGYNGYGSYSFKSQNTAAQEEHYWLKTYDRYLSYADKINIDGHDYGYHYDDITIQTKGDIIFKKALDEYSSWNLDFDSNGYVYMSRYNEGNRYGQENVDNPISMQWTGSYVQHGYFGYFFGSSNVRILRKVDIADASNYHFYIYKKGDKTHYEPDETAVLDGLEMEVTYKSGEMKFIVSYENEPSYFIPGKAHYDTQTLSFKWCNVEADYLVTVDKEIIGEHYYNQLKTSTTPKDIRGTYLLGVDHNNATNVLQLSNLSSSEGHPEVVSLGSELDEICDKNNLNEFITNVTDNVFEIVYDTDGYYVKIGSSYLCKYDSGHNYYLLYLGNRASAMKVCIGLNGTLMTPDNDLFIYDYSNGASGVYLNKDNHVGGNEYEMVLYKKEFSTEEVNELETYRTSFFNNTNACTNNDTTVLENIGWSTLTTEFNNLSVDAQGYLACLTYNHNAEVPGSLNDMVDRYDYIISKYKVTVFPDFMGRMAANTYQSNFITVTPEALLFIKDINNSTTIITVIVVSSLTLVALYFIIKRKKHILD